MPRVTQNRAGELQLGLRRLLLAQISGEIGRRIIARLESLALDVAKKCDGAVGALQCLGAAGPDRLVIPALIEAFGRRLLRLAIDEARKAASNQVVQL